MGFGLVTSYFCCCSMLRPCRALVFLPGHVEEALLEGLVRGASQWVGHARLLS